MRITESAAVFETVTEGAVETDMGEPDQGQPYGLGMADGDRQGAIVGDQFAGRVGLFLRVDDFDRAYERMVAAGVRVRTPA